MQGVYSAKKVHTTYVTSEGLCSVPHMNLKDPPYWGCTFLSRGQVTSAYTLVVLSHRLKTVSRGSILTQSNKPRPSLESSFSVFKEHPRRSYGIVTGICLLVQSHAGPYQIIEKKIKLKNYRIEIREYFKHMFMYGLFFPDLILIKDEKPPISKLILSKPQQEETETHDFFKMDK
ncbi:hypothetical protein LOTGIDRAFT_157210 [Lottia gigantea]|uniref:Uncharacterized protein n=1 Tax=Lottia gigantea TaxID=225164 RepID=V4ADI0_LOTGI|nr:hypothetical protein LOTGIDRAFT_157210 [Lottia gigantea]ESP02069.1 hypothetical protein LOTGIDRAFT_157210 [Lottia gigantea]